MRRPLPIIDPQNPPPRVDRKLASELLLARLGFRVSHRTLEAWPVPTRRVNGRATFETAELLAYARGLLDAAPAIQGGSKAEPRAA